MDIRNQHKLKPNKTGKFPRHYIFVDTETREITIDKNTKELRLLLGVAKYIRRRDNGQISTTATLHFEHVTTFWQWVVSKSLKRTKLIIIAHNMSFDSQVLDTFNQLWKLHYPCTKFINNGKVAIWNFSKYESKTKPQYKFDYSSGELSEIYDVSTITLIDNMNFFNTSLAELGKSIGFPKMDYKSALKDIDKLKVYCENDVDIMVKAWDSWRSFIVDNDLGVFGQTLAGQALNSYRHRFMPVEIFIHDNDKATQLERDGYFGGRTECFYLGEITNQPVSYYDVNSLYPYVMKSFKYPCNLVGHYKNMNLNDLKFYLGKYGAMVDVLLQTYEPVYPKRMNGRLCFPIGEFWTTLCGDELDSAIKKDHIRRIGRVNLYKWDYLFTDYVDYFYKSRKHYEAEKNIDFAYACKIILNSLYGKFGQLIDEYELVDDSAKADMKVWSMWDVDNQEWITFRHIGNKIEKTVGKKESYNSFAAISAFVTSNARSHLLNLIKTIGFDQCLYCDTDSIFAIGHPSKFAHILNIGANLGQLKLEKWTNYVDIRGLKDYTFGKQRRIKGVRKNTKIKPDGSYTTIQFRNIKGALRDGETGKQITKMVTKNLSRQYHKGRVLPGGNVRPFVLTEGLT